MYLQQFCKRVKAIDDWATGAEQNEAAETDTTLKNDSGLKPCVSLLRGLAAELDASPDYTRTHAHSSPVELQLSCYANDAFYRPHRDSPTLGTSSSFALLGLKSWLQVRHYRKRAITAILYLNVPMWDVEKDGGALNVYLGTDDDDETGESATKIISVVPSGGTLVLFDSEEMLHEVVPTASERFALTCWICGERGASPLPRK
jgi:Rps23 Pro-64 3,4-dihydroxylase Tpa1-like proline 4-hydroxylase